ncbi:MAG: hypothetical protein SAL07_02470 [Oscillatoria sp. PMC 1051.18]|uniref:hypothetical protein n=1 Tax=Oscillatoria salina TaxID=331517 RepID=UPI0013BAD54D|nr:hypothetical protein [Oscillatoria salina]MBZ8182997.1 hypothetical protein [Oscillatoria salina IIICB1]MEC4892217.1 hypothetical protein [Oscillatoria sp. PMC 1050.18]MEC5028751.1 hypothetical protein [Oscillatoria sp. PMC 1051.18]NET91547.1 hypothetical protein [Kamptonema sp. SIO1D9]
MLDSVVALVNSGLSDFLALSGTVLAQTVTEPNVLDQMREAFGQFVESGQLWALIIGLVIGYLFKTFFS